MKTKFPIGRIVVCTILIILLWCFYPYILKTYLHQEHAGNLGQYGDIYGGLNTLFTGLAFVGLVVTIFLQRQEMRETREEFEKQTAIMTRQTLDAAMFEHLKYIRGISIAKKNFSQAVEDALDLISDFSTLKQYRGRDASTCINEIRCSLMEFSSWRKVISSWFNRVNATPWPNPDLAEQVKYYKVAFWNLLTKQERCLAFIQTALVACLHDEEWEEMQQLFADSILIRDYFQRCRYNDRTYSMLINLLHPTSNSEEDALILSKSEVSTILANCKNGEARQYKCPSCQIVK